MQIEDGPDEEGNYYTRPGKLSDLLPLPYSNDEAAKAANFGAYPPDLTYMIFSKRNGKNYLFSLLTGWMEPPAGVSLTDRQYFNVYFPGNVMGMPQVNIIRYILLYIQRVRKKNPCRFFHLQNPQPTWHI